VACGDGKLLFNFNNNGGDMNRLDLIHDYLDSIGEVTFAHQGMAGVERLNKALAAARELKAVQLEPQVCCGDYEKCMKACTPRGQWLAEKELAKPEQVSGDTSDGYHTFNELYDFRKAYNAALFNEWAQNNKYSVHKSKRHFDGEDCFGGGWFIVVAQLPDGQISNHYEMKDWDRFQLPETDKALFEYDNHTGADVLHRLFSLRQLAQPEQERNFCQRCGKRLVDGHIHTCTPPAQKALDKKAENARELGLDYEPEQEPVPFPSFMRKRIEQAMEDAINPRGMSVHDGKAKVLASDLHRMLLVIDSATQRKKWVGLTDDEIKVIVDLHTQDDVGYDIFCDGESVAQEVIAKLKEKNCG
jgi:hypothetical protein